MTLHWLNPLALAGLAAAALPVVIHLLKRHRATRVPFPTLRFLTDSRAAAVQIRTLSDPLLLAAARRGDRAPPFSRRRSRTSSRRGSGRRRAIGGCHAPSSSIRARARRLATRNRDEAVAAGAGAPMRSSRFAAEQAGASLCQAAAALLERPAARHEIVVISDFQHGSMTDADVACVPVRHRAAVRPDRATPGREAASATLAGLPARRQDDRAASRIRRSGTRVSLQARAARGGPRTEDPGAVRRRGGGRAARAAPPREPARRRCRRIAARRSSFQACRRRGGTAARRLDDRGTGQRREKTARFAMPRPHGERPRSSTLSAVWVPVVRSATRRGAGFGRRRRRRLDGVGVCRAGRRVVASPRCARF